MYGRFIAGDAPLERSPAPPDIKAAIRKRLVGAIPTLDWLGPTRKQPRQFSRGCSLGREGSQNCPIS
jgi:hypothetical protein